MAQQRLYTEEQVKKIIDLAEFGRHIFHRDILEKFTPIELPSDEEIEEMLGSGMHDFYKGGFIECANWMRDKIINQKK